MAPSDTIWLELISKSNLNLYLIEPGNEIFIPTFVWPKNPTVQVLKPDHAWVDMKLTKTKTSLRKGTCNNDQGYVYGGKQVLLRCLL